MTRTLTFTPRIWAALDSGDLTLPVARALQLAEGGMSIYAAARQRGQHLKTVQRAWKRIGHAPWPWPTTKEKSPEGLESP